MLCHKCGEDKTDKDFYKWDLYKCKICRKKWERARYPSRKKYLHKYYVEWYSNPENKIAHYESSKKSIKEWRNKNKEKVYAHGVLNRALHNGKIDRPDRCSKCFCEEKLHAHHPDYNKPLEVIWLCRSCHEILHLAMK